MKTFKILLAIFVISLMTSCTSLQVVASSTPQVAYTFEFYDYNTIHHLFLTNPQYFYDNYYYDNYGVRRYYHNHPYFIRYCNYRNITPNHNRYKNTYVNGKRTTLNRRVIINRNIPVIRTNNSTNRRITISRANIHTTSRANIHTTPTNSVRQRN